ncbi:phosphatidylinositol-specific phospholipase C [Clostridium tarantellae]|uniref:1-phosphatidylinositol phosphodiesterase n=1 Tax=Clostridium tarantellae TaxID=39493 RepID=A0A6I1MST2_9CLOT|nr:phosphatidylinositol-specific phospholipase C [Clostridium tarantellae]MPQ43299.1 phosphatidylinositol-specific phospholipase C domain-containing protein [Clostridium tarantellae]
MGGFKRIFVDCKTEGYSHTKTICENKSKWMAKLNNNRTLSALSIPGTHDTMSISYGGDSAQNQSKDLKTQLISGIRFLDIRLAAYPNSEDFLYAHHEFIYLYSNFNEILNIVTDFLKNNESETLLMRIRQEYTKEPSNIFVALIKKFLNNPKYSNYLYKNIWNNNPTLGELRGKIIILQDFSGLVKGLDYSYFNIQDDYYLLTNWDLYSKWEKVKAHLLKANESFSKRENKSFINYLSGSGGCFPYFVASGHSSSSPNSPRLSTGLTEPGFTGYYPDFPRVNWFLGVFATIAFEGTNNLTKDYIDKNNPAYVGIVVADFPGQGLINSIINVNNRV